MLETYRDLVEFSELVAEAIIKKTQPTKDDLSLSQARELYGVSWINQMRREGLAEVHAKGKRLVYSRHQLDCLRAAQRRQAELARRAG